MTHPLIPTSELFRDEKFDICFSPFEEYMNFYSIRHSHSPQVSDSWNHRLMVIVGHIKTDTTETGESLFEISSPSNFHERFPHDIIKIKHTPQLLDYCPVAIYVSYTNYEDKESSRYHHFTVEEQLTKALHQHILSVPLPPVASPPPPISVSAAAQSAAAEAETDALNETDYSSSVSSSKPPETTTTTPPHNYSNELYLSYLSKCDTLPYSITHDELNFILH